MKETAQKFFDIRAKKDELEGQLEVVKQEYLQAEKELVLIMEQNGLQNFTDAERGMCYMREAIYARVTDEAKCFDWLKANGLGECIKYTIHNKTLGTLVKDKGEIPGVEYHLESKIGFRRA